MEFVKLLKDPNALDLNKGLLLRLDPYENNTLLYGDLIYLEAVNKAERNIFIPPGTTVQLFRYDYKDKTWVELTDSVNHYGDGITTYPAGKGGLSSAFIVVNPIIETPKEEEQIRIALTGFYLEDGKITSEGVTAFVDVKISVP